MSQLNINIKDFQQSMVIDPQEAVVGGFDVKLLHWLETTYSFNVKRDMLIVGKHVYLPFAPTASSLPWLQINSFLDEEIFIMKDYWYHCA